MSWLTAGALVSWKLGEYLGNSLPLDSMLVGDVASSLGTTALLSFGADDLTAVFTVSSVPGWLPARKRNVPEAICDGGRLH